MRSEQMSVFGDPVEPVELAGKSPAGDMRFIRERLTGLETGGRGALRLYHPRATAAFSRLDSIRPGYEAARSVVHLFGFEPVLRSAGGHLAVYGPGTIAIDLIAAHQNPRITAMTRFVIFARLLADALRNGGLDPVHGPVPGEYCPGSQSISSKGRKIAGLGQRLTRCGYHLGAIVMLQNADDIRMTLQPAYRALGIPFNPATVGAACDANPAFDVMAFETRLRKNLEGSMELASVKGQELVNGD